MHSRLVSFGRRVFAPRRALLLILLLGWAARASAQVVINEVMASNETAVENEGIYPDWVELYNSSTSAIDISDWSLSDSVSSPRKFIFPAGTVIPGRGYVVVWCDGLTTAPGLHASFSLSGTTDDMSLYDSTVMGGVQRDIVNFGIQITDLTIGRVPDGSPNPFTLTRPTPLLANQPVPLGVQDNLKVNEIMADPGSGDDWFEMYNASSNYVQFGGLIWSDRTNTPATNRAIPALSFVVPEGFVQFFADNLQNRDADQTDFRLAAGGEAVVLFRSNAVSVIDSIIFGAQTEGASHGRLPDGSTNLVSFAPGRSTPAESNFQLLTDIIINEVLTHTDPPVEDAIEFYNPTANPIDISYYWLSNSKDDPKKFRIPAGTIIPAGGYRVFYEWPMTVQGFNSNGMGSDRSFTLNSARGDQVYLHSADALGNLTYFRLSRSFGPAENGVSFGRYVTSEGKTDFVPMSRHTFGVSNPTSLTQFRNGTGTLNAYPKIGPLVISEINYHPPDAELGIDNILDEYIELYNMSPGIVPLYDPAVPANTWRLRGVADFDFPIDIRLNPAERLLVVSFDPAANAAQLAAFRSKFAVAANVQILGPYSGRLPNGDGSVELYKPDPPQTRPPDVGLVPYILVDRVQYEDDAPWPTTADGGGSALERLRPEEYGNDPINWVAATPSPGRQVIRIESVQRSGTVNTIRFQGIANTGYTLQYRTDLPGPGSSVWNKAIDVPAQTTTGPRTATDSTTNQRRFYRIVTPIQP